MNNEDLKKGNNLSHSIDILRNEIEKVSSCHSSYEVSLMYGRDRCEIINSFVNFKSLKQNILTEMKKELARLEKEFKNL